MKLRYSHEDVERWRDRVYRGMNGANHNGQAGRRFIKKVGYCFIYNSQDDGLPCFEEAVQDHGHNGTTKELRAQLTAANHVYCGRVLRRRPTMVSMEFLPFFYALSGLTGSREDHVREYARGNLSEIEHDIVNCLAKSRSMDGTTLRRRMMKRSASTAGEFNKALAVLQSRMYIARSEGSEWALMQKVHRKEIRRAGKITHEQARFAILHRYFQNRLIATVMDIVRLFGWKKKVVYETLGHLIDRGVIASGASFENHKGIHYCLIRR